MTRTLAVCLTLWGAGCAALAEDVPPAEPGATTRPLELKDVRVDFTKRQVIIEAEVCLREGPLELLLCKWSTKEHESILRTRALPSHVHFALLALGLTPGKPARWLPGAEGTEGRLLPPRGAGLKISLRWTGQDGAPRSAEAGDWLKPVAADRVKPPSTWVFVGSDILPGNRYWADGEGDLICVANFASAVIDVPFESSDKSALLEFAANTQAIPPAGTKVEVVIDVLPGAQDAEHARVILEIDRFGQCRAAGRPIPPDRLSDWAQEYLQRHSQGQVVLRADARSLAADVERVREQLLFGGLRDVIEERLPLRGELLPRTEEQKQASLKQWAQSFADAQNLLSDPAEDAQSVLRQIRYQIHELEQMTKLWQDYAASLREMLTKYRASTQPASAESADEDRE